MNINCGRLPGVSRRTRELFYISKFSTFRSVESLKNLFHSALHDNEVVRDVSKEVINRTSKK
jgi:hypothetical protein